MASSSARAHELAREYRAPATTILRRRGAWQVVDALQQISEPSALVGSAGYAPLRLALQDAGTQADAAMAA